MDFFTALQISSSGMTAERKRMNLISGNIANVNSTRTPEGGPYKRKDAVFTASPLQEGKSFSSALQKAGGPRGVEVSQVVEDQNPPRLVFDPQHPDANPQGYVQMPNVNVVEEMSDMIVATRAYEANVTAAQAAKSMALKTLELGK